MAGVATATWGFTKLNVAAIFTGGSSAVIATAGGFIMGAGAFGFAFGAAINEGLHASFPDTFASWSDVL